MPLVDLLRELDHRIVNDPELSAEFFTDYLARQHDLGLLQGDRPTCRFLRPHILDRSQYDEVCQAASVIAGAFEKVAAATISDTALVEKLGLTKLEAKLARIDPGYSNLCITSRLDAYLGEQGFQFLEYNAETPAGVGDQMQLEKLLFSLKHNAKFLEEQRHWRPQPHRELLSALISAYREYGGAEENPQIVIVDWKGVATGSEFRILQDYFVSAGFPTHIVDPSELRFDGDKLWYEDFRVDIVYKRVVIHEFLERLGEDHPLVNAYVAGRVCMVNSFRSKIAHKKAGFAILSDPEFEHLFEASELAVIRERIPWTRCVAAGVTTFEGREHELLDVIRSNRERLVLKPNDDYGGHGVFIGWEMGPEEWESALAVALAKPYVVQERVPVRKHAIPMFTDRVSSEEMFVDFNPFLFRNRVEGALIRLSSSSLLNVTSGGGQTALLVLENED